MKTKWKGKTTREREEEENKKLVNEGLLFCFLLVIRNGFVPPPTLCVCVCVCVLPVLQVILNCRRWLSNSDCFQ